MTSQQIKAALAPCGLNCAQCFAHVDGEVRRYSQKLREALGNFAPYARGFETILGEEVFRKYPDFAELLAYLAQGQCQGCRNEQCKLFQGCGVRPCHQAKGVDFCAECDEFPCERTKFPPALRGAWLKVNQIIQDKGIEAYYQLSMARPRYV